MNFFTYLGIGCAEFVEKYLTTRLVQVQHHPTFPLDIYTYGRETVHDSAWDAVTMKCRGIIVNRDSEEIVARPFEKFFNFGSTEVPGLTSEDVETMDEQPVIWEKVDGFLCTLYRWEGKNYVASKGSFTSPHAKWATHWIQNSAWKDWDLTTHTAIFEGICSSLRIVVDYGKREEMVLLAIIDNETGEEFLAEELQLVGKGLNTKTPMLHAINWQEAYQNSYDETLTNVEGYVLTWYKNDRPPFRLKMKFADYLRLHRMVTGVSPKRVLEVLQNGWTTEMDSLLNESTPWFNKFVARWKRTIEGEYKRLDDMAEAAMGVYRGVLNTQYLSNGILPMRKDWAMLINRPETKEVSAIMFAIMDGKDKSQVIWKQVRNSPLLKGGKPMIDGHSL